MARFPLFGTLTQGRSARVTAQEHVNVYAEMVRSGDRDSLSYYGRPGLQRFTSLGETPIRGMLAIGNLLYVVHRGTLYSVNNAAQETALGTLDTTSGRVGMTHNGTQILIVDGVEGYTWNIDTTTFAKITDADFVVANTCDVLGGFFVVDNADSGQFNISAGYDGTSWDPLDFATAEAFPDDLVRVYVEAGQLLLFGERSTEWWANVGNADFPFAPVTGAVMEWGLAARWSVADVEGTCCFLGQNRTGEVQVLMLRGYGVEPVGGPEFNHTINQYDAWSDATAFGYTVDNHSFYQINFPSAGECWAVSMRTGMATRMQYGTLGARHRAEMSEQWLNRTIVADYEDGTLYRVDTNVYDDNGMSFAKQLQGRHVFDEERFSVSEMRLDMEPGVGNASGAGADPQAMLQVSKDGGHSWGPERWKEIGGQGEYRQRCVWRRLGMARDWVFRVRVSDPVKFVCTGAWVNTS